MSNVLQNVCDALALCMYLSGEYMNLIQMFKCLYVSDLRQDMLTLQVIRIMDRIWQSEGLNLRSGPPSHI